MLYQAHKGVSTENPENTMPAFKAAVEQGYGLIELDVGVTSDLRFVTIHDGTVNRTGRLANGDPIPNEVSVSGSTYSELTQYDFGIAFSKKFKGTKIPLFDDVLSFAKEKGIPLKIDNKYQWFNPVQREAFFELLKPYEDIAQLTCSNVEELERAAAVFGKMKFHYDGEISEEILKRINAFLPKERLTAWLPHKNANTSWVTVGFANEEKAAMIKKYAGLGIWILSRNEYLDEVEAFEPDVIETNGQLKPENNRGVVADMHTHSEASHDSTCKIEAMAHSQQEKGTDLFAVTDHFDTDSYNAYDVFTPIRSAFDKVRALNSEKPSVLTGIEISEGFWHPDICEKALNMLEYDVIIGSVHLVKYKELTYAYSQIDFSLLEKAEIVAYLDAYFDDVLTMLDTVDFDILAHLTCPLRYISGKYGVELDMSVYAEKIEKILQKIISRGIALEVNTSSLEAYGILMPDEDILKKYYAMGGYLITLGSDAHTEDRASADFSEGISLLKKIGFRNAFYYKGRRPYQITI